MVQTTDELVTERVLTLTTSSKVNHRCLLPLLSEAKPTTATEVTLLLITHHHHPRRLKLPRQSLHQHDVVQPTIDQRFRKRIFIILKSAQFCSILLNSAQFCCPKRLCLPIFINTAMMRQQLFLSCVAMLPLLSLAFSAVAISSCGTATTRRTTTTTATTLFGLFDGVKDAFSAPTLERSQIDAERETPIDRWMGWSVASENKKNNQKQMGKRGSDFQNEYSLEHSNMYLVLFAVANSM
jgi:hypothetical protein